MNSEQIASAHAGTMTGFGAESVGVQWSEPLALSSEQIAAAQAGAMEELAALSTADKAAARAERSKEPKPRKT